MSNVLVEARSAQREAAREKTVHISLALLESLILEIENLQDALELARKNQTLRPVTDARA